MPKVGSCTLFFIVELQLILSLTAAWDSPPRRDDPAWDCFEKAFGFFVSGRNVRVPTLSRTQLKESDDRLEKDFYRKNFKINQGLIEDRKLRDFQVSNLTYPASQLFILLYQIEGVNWLYYKWWSKQSGTILADEMVSHILIICTSTC